MRYDLKRFTLSNDWLFTENGIKQGFGVVLCIV
jgi:hypothetical protein